MISLFFFFSPPFVQLKPHYRHLYSGECVLQCGRVSHVRLVIAPDGGVSRLRLWGHIISNASTNPHQISKLWPLKLHQSGLIAQNHLGDMVVWLKKKNRRISLLKSQVKFLEICFVPHSNSCLLKRTWHWQSDHFDRRNLSMEITQYYTCSCLNRT